MLSVSWAVMAHPKRADLVKVLLEELGEPDMHVVWDRKDDRWDTGRRSMLAYDPACSHHAVIQDDVIPALDLVAAMPTILERLPYSAPLCGYVGSVRPSVQAVGYACKEADRLGASFIRLHTLNWGPLIVVPTDAIKEMIHYSDKLTEIQNYDRRLSRYWELARREPVWYTWPAVVDHRDGPSLVPGRNGAHRNGPGSRVARKFLSGSALEANWDGPVVDETYCGRYAGRPCATWIHRPSGKRLTVPTDSYRAKCLAANHLWEPMP
jgi:hypothetical protein